MCTIRQAGHTFARSTGGLNLSRNIDGHGLITQRIDDFQGIQAAAGRLPATMEIFRRCAEPVRRSLRITM
jgi:hypothetical protein